MRAVAPLAVGVAVASVLAGGVTYAVSAPKPVRACANGSGVLVLLKGAKCAKGTHAITIAGKGATGPAGPQGPPGGTGGPGITGPAATRGNPFSKAIQLDANEGTVLAVGPITYTLSCRLNQADEFDARFTAVSTDALAADGIEVYGVAGGSSSVEIHADQGTTILAAAAETSSATDGGGESIIDTFTIRDAAANVVHDVTASVVVQSSAKTGGGRTATCTANGRVLVR